MFRTAPRVARYTWSRQWPAFLLEGCAVGLIGLSTFAVKRSLGGRDDVVPWLIVLWQVGWILSPAVGPLLARGDPQRTWRRIGLVAGVPLLLCALVSVEPTGKAGHGTGNLALFMGLTFLHYLSMIAHIPHRGALIRTNYPPDVRGRFFGLLGGVFVVGAAISA
ncbi:MAG: hypothetical protein OER88_09810, partial [Planctomycetota bacterium]|nr:hypothetical protein [Planctomycetota bacterium]